MRRWTSIVAALAALALVVGGVSLGVVTRRYGRELVTNPKATRHMPGRTPADYGMPFEDVVVRTADGLWLKGWYVPSRNGAGVMVQHGYKADRGEMLNEARMLQRHGYGVLISSLRAHDGSDGERLTFGLHEMKDFEAWMQLLVARPDLDAARLGMIGNSMGATLVIQFAAADPRVKAVVANSAFSSLEDTVETSIRFFTGLPPFPFAPMIAFWAEREAGFRAGDVDAKRWIGRISPRPVFLMQGGNDSVISAESGRRLFDAAGEPRELWFDPKLRHTAFDTARAEEYERRVVAFFDTHLPATEPVAGSDVRKE
jgi:dipeptidyl aminopeptidase/acylaminoacyl peptidase